MDYTTVRVEVLSISEDPEAFHFKDSVSTSRGGNEMIVLQYEVTISTILHYTNVSPVVLHGALVNRDTQSRFSISTKI